MSPSKIPVTVLTGFLGAGKTTLINQLLANATTRRIGIVVNEFGEVGIDGALIDVEEDAVVELKNGCVCCTVRADLVGSVMRLLNAAGGPLDRLIVETSGLADPAPVLQTFLADEELLQRVALDSVVTVVDAAHLHLHVDDEIVREQIAFADTIIVNKISRLERSSIGSFLYRLRTLNPAAVVKQTDYAAVAVTDVLGTSRFCLDRLLAIEPCFLSEETHDHEHDGSIQSWGVTVEQPLDAERFSQWIQALLTRNGARILRGKAILAFREEARMFLFHSVHMLVDVRPGRPFKQAERRESRIVFIGRDLDPAELKQGLMACVMAESPYQEGARK